MSDKNEAPSADTEALRAMFTVIRRQVVAMEDGKLSVYRHAIDITPLFAAGWPSESDDGREAIRQAMAKLDDQWVTITGLPPLDDSNAWRQAAMRAGYTPAQLDVLRWSRLVESVADWFQSWARDQHGIRSPRRCRLVVTNDAATFDGKPLKVTPKQAEGLGLLVEKGGEYVAITPVIRPERLQRGLPGELLALIDTCSAGTRLLKGAWQT